MAITAPLFDRLTKALEEANNLCWELLRTKLSQYDVLPYGNDQIVKAIEDREELVREALPWVDVPVPKQD